MEFPGLGKRCSQKDCGQLDFLPAECIHCRLTFCGDHLSPFVHECGKFKDTVLTDADLADKERERWQVTCSYGKCGVKDLLPMKCSKCVKHFCLSHRHTDQHECEATKKEEAEKVEASQKAVASVQTAKEVQSKMATDINRKLEEAKSAGGAKAAMATKLALMKLKGRAKGDASVLQTDRIFFSVDCPNKEQNPKPLDVWMGKSWTMGKAIDFMARQARIKNKNNIGNAPKLHIFKGESCISKPSDRSVKEVFEDGIIVDGDHLEFRLIEEPSS